MRGGLTLRLALTSGLLAMIVGAVFVVLLVAVEDQRDSARLAANSRRELTAAQGLEKLVLDSETGVRGFVIAQEERFLQPWVAARAAFGQQARQFLEQIDDRGQLARARRLLRDAAAYIRAYSRSVVNAVRRGAEFPRTAAATADGKRRVDALRAQFDAYTARERGILNRRQASANADADRAIIVGAVGLAGSVALIVLLATYLLRAVGRPIRRAAGMADRLARGDLAVRMPETGAGEIGELEHSFNVMAGSLEQSRDELRRLADEQAALRRVATLVAQGVPPADVFETVTREVGLLCDADFARMERYEPGGTVMAVAGWSRSHEKLATGMPIVLDGVSIVAQVRETRRPARVDSFVGASGAVAEEARALGIRSSVGCPIVVEGRLWGVIAASTKREAPFPPGTESQIAEFTELVATAVANAESRAELQRLADEQAALRRVATLVAQAVPPPAVFAAVAEEVGRLMEADRTFLVRYETDDSVVVVAAWSATGVTLPIGGRAPLQPGDVTMLVRETGRAARIDHYDDEARAAADFDIRSAVAAPISVEGGLWGVMVVASGGDEPPPPGSEARLAEFTELVATAIANAQSRDELLASRTRIVTAADEARRRLERDLHDGAQQRLVHAVITLRMARQALENGGRQADALVAEALDHAERATAELRELAHGILPSVLTRGGLQAGVEALASRISLPVKVQVTGDRLPPPLEAAAYFIVSEALTNAAKHARANRALVRAEVKDGELCVEVRDDGVGGATLENSTGLLGLNDRVAAFGGRFEVDSPPGNGTRIAATLPVARAQPD